MTWLETHPEEAPEVYEEKQKDIEKIANPLLTKAYGGAAGGGMPGMPGGMPGGGMPGGGMPGAGGGKGPDIEEVD